MAASAQEAANVPSGSLPTARGASGTTFSERWTLRHLAADHAADLARTVFTTILLLIPLVFSGPLAGEGVSVRAVCAFMVVISLALMVMIDVERLGSRRLLERRDAEIRELRRQVDRLKPD
jgi:hypothetical protein